MAGRSHPILLALPEGYKPLGLSVGSSTKSDVLQVLQDKGAYLVSKEEPLIANDGVKNPNGILFTAEFEFEYREIQFRDIEFVFYKDCLARLRLLVSEKGRPTFNSICLQLEAHFRAPAIQEDCGDPNCHNHGTRSADWNYGFFELSVMEDSKGEDIDLIIEDSPLMQMLYAEDEMVRKHFCDSCRQENPRNPAHPELAVAVNRLKPFGLIPGKSTIGDFYTLVKLEAWKITLESSDQEGLKSDLFDGITARNISQIFNFSPDEVVFYFYRGRFYSMGARIQNSPELDYDSIKNQVEAILGGCHYQNNPDQDQTPFYGWTFGSIDIFLPKLSNNSTLLVMKNKSMTEIMAEEENDLFVDWLRIFEENRQKAKKREMLDNLWSVLADGPGSEWIDDLFRQFLKYGGGYEDKILETREPDITELNGDDTDISSLDPALIELFMSAPGNHHLLISLSCTFSQHFIIRALAHEFLKTSEKISVLGMKSAFGDSEMFSERQDFTFEDPAGFSLNPFLVIDNLDEPTLDILIPLMGEMIFPEKDLSGNQQEILRHHITDAFCQNTPMNYLANSLMSGPGKQEKIMGQKLLSFLKKNGRKAYFEDDPYSYPSQPLEVFEFKQFKHDKPMASVALLAVLFNIIQTKCNEKDYSRSIILLDGTHSLLKKGSGERFLNLAGEAFKNSGGAIVTSVGGFKKFLQSSHGKVLSQLGSLFYTDQPISDKNKRVQIF